MKIKCFLLSLLATILTANASTEINYIVIQDQAQPFQNHVNQKEHSGIVTDIVKQIFDGADYDLKIHTLPFNRMIKMLEQDKYKNWITFGSPNWPGVQSLNLSAHPIFEVKHGFLTTKQRQPITSAKDLFGQTVILLHGFNYPGLDEHIASKKVKSISVKNYPAAFKVVNRFADKAGFVEMDIRIKYNLKKEGVDISDYTIHDFSGVISNYHLHLAMSGNFDESAQQHVNKRLAELQNDGSLAAIIAAY